MVFYMQNELKPYLLSIDIEHDEQKIIQISGIMLQSIADNIYQICRSINLYVRPPHSLSSFIQQYTGISSSFIEEYGVSLEEANQAWEEFLEGIDRDDLLIFSHGIFQDLELLTENGFYVDDYEIWDTLNLSKYTFNRDTHLTLQELVSEAGLPPIQQHNAYSDALSTLLLYSYLLKTQGDD